jgi:hypothetical protein
MMRRRMGRPGLVGTMARTAVVAGTATAVVGGVKGHNAKKQQASADQAAADQAAVESQQQMADMQAQMDAMTALLAPADYVKIDDTMMAELKKLAYLKAAGVLTDAEFSAAKAKILGL